MKITLPFRCSHTPVESHYRLCGLLSNDTSAGGTSLWKTRPYPPACSSATCVCLAVCLTCVNWNERSQPIANTVPHPRHPRPLFTRIHLRKTCSLSSEEMTHFEGSPNGPNVSAVHTGSAATPKEQKPPKAGRYLSGSLWEQPGNRAKRAGFVSHPSIHVHVHRLFHNHGTRGPFG